MAKQQVSELVSASIILQYWTSALQTWEWSLIIVFPVFAIQLINVRTYGEAEFWLSLIKVLVIVLFIIFEDAEDQAYYDEQLVYHRAVLTPPRLPSKADLIFSLNNFKNCADFDFAAAFTALLGRLHVTEDAAPVAGPSSPIEEVPFIHTWESIANAALHPLLTEHMLVVYKPVWMHVVAYWLAEERDKLSVLSAFAKTLGANPATELLFQKFFSAIDNPFDLLKHSNDRIQWPAQIPPPTPTTNTEPCTFEFHPRLLDLLLALYRLSTASDLRQVKNWPIELIALFRTHPSLPIRLLALKIYKNWQRISDQTYDKLIRTWVYSPPAGDILQLIPPLKDEQQEDCLIGELSLSPASKNFAVKDNLYLCSERRSLDVWTIDATDAERMRQLALDFMASSSSPSDMTDLIPPAFDSLAFFHGLALPSLSNSDKSKVHNFVPTSSAIAVLRQMALATIAKTPVLLSSVPSAGKSTVLNELCAAFCFPEDQIVQIDLSDRSIDAKSLLGTLASSTSQPGVFDFMDGVVTRCLKMGKWLVVNNIDKAADDVLVLLASLAHALKHDQTVHVSANGSEVHAAVGFMLFATRQDSANQGKAFIGDEHWNTIHLETPSQSEMEQIVKSRFPLLAHGIDEELIAAWLALKEEITILTKTLSIRQLFRWCARVENVLPTDLLITSLLHNPSVQENAFLEAFDVFLAWWSDPSHTAYHSIISTLSRNLNLSQDRIKWLLDERPVTLVKQIDNVCIGRARLQCPASSHDSTSATFALTRTTMILLERLAVGVRQGEPLLVVGETGTGKSTTVAQLADLLGQKLISLNLSNQTEISDLIGGFKPMNLETLAWQSGQSLLDNFIELFDKTFGLSNNEKYIASARTAFSKKKWSRLLALIRQARGRALKRLSVISLNGKDFAKAPKRRKTDFSEMLQSWADFDSALVTFEVRFVKSSQTGQLLFQYVDGPLVQALQSGYWVLLDEINLATSETLDVLQTLLQSTTSSFILSEKGTIEPIHRHPNFKLFGCMNPATDIGKRDLLPDIRSRFTELYVTSLDNDIDALNMIVYKYLGNHSIGDRAVIADIATTYQHLKQLSQNGSVADSGGQPPHYSIRTLVRSLMFATRNVANFGLRRAIYEGFIMTFVTMLDNLSEAKIINFLQTVLLHGSDRAKALLLKLPIRDASTSDSSILFHHFSLPVGPLAPLEATDYILTPSVSAKLIALARVVSAKSFPVLIQGPTSSGKTSMIEYLAKRTGHRFIRINNHQHTDIQEYLGSYAADPVSGCLNFREGLLVQALRQGSWIVLDELNLAPSDVLEALNRLLDDNRELFVPELNEIVRPAPGFMLFATQNPPSYAGRKPLSRAFRNRFMELFFDDVPRNELATILERRCQIAPSYAEKIVQVFSALQHQRQREKVFEDKNAFATLRDLFRWGSREAIGYEALAKQGYMLLAERVRTSEDRLVVQRAIETTMKVSIQIEELYPAPVIPNTDKSAPFIWTYAARRLYNLALQALKNHEPVLLCGETGSGKTSVCETLASSLNVPLRVVNCHLNTDASDLLGGYRPNRNHSPASMPLEVRGLFEELNGADSDRLSIKRFFQNALDEHSDDPIMHSRIQSVLNDLHDQTSLFLWKDGPLVTSMLAGGLFVMDEISLADDSVLERLNSVLEPGRSLTLAEKGGVSNDMHIVANHDFHLIATMNPGGDYGKKELSPALRNRFTEIWVPAMTEREDDLIEIIQNVLPICRTDTPTIMLSFAKWFHATFRHGHALSLRDLVAWASFLNVASSGKPSAVLRALVHGALMVYTGSVRPFEMSRSHLETMCVDELNKLLHVDLSEVVKLAAVIEDESALFVGPFRLRKQAKSTANDFQFDCPTTVQNVLGIVRAMQISKPILLEGSPGVGKTAIIQALAHALGIPLTRINLSDQTDLADLFGADVPCSDGPLGEFRFDAAPFLSAMQDGHWVLLDEMNLAPQQVLEGLNSCLDHRQSVFIPELGRTFRQAEGFRIFAAQNPLEQGGGRKGLPRSYLDRFTRVMIDELRATDFSSILTTRFPDVDPSFIEKAILFNTAVSNISGVTFATAGSPWDHNLRDLTRWLKLTISSDHSCLDVRELADHYVDCVYLQRLRNQLDRLQVCTLFAQVFGRPLCIADRPTFHVTENSFSFANSIFERLPAAKAVAPTSMPQCLRSTRAIATALFANHLSIVVSESVTGPMTVLQNLARLTGNVMSAFAASSQTDALDLLGAFEQTKSTTNVVADLLRVQLHIERAIETESDTSVDNISKMRDLLLDLAAILSLNESELFQTAQTFFSRLASLFPSDFSGLAGKYSQHHNAANAFVWRDGPLVQAMKQGHWFVIRHANLCPSSVLDRFNSLFDTQSGALLLNERGLLSDTDSAEVVSPHPNFRLILCVDPRQGGLSRAMRNRGIEIFLDTPNCVPPSVKSDTLLPVDSTSLHELGFNSRFHKIETFYTKLIENVVKARNSVGIINKEQDSVRTRMIDLALEIHRPPSDPALLDRIARMHLCLSLSAMCPQPMKRTALAASAERHRLHSFLDSLFETLVGTCGIPQTSTRAYGESERALVLVRDLTDQISHNILDTGSVCRLLDDAIEDLCRLDDAIGMAAVTLKSEIDNTRSRYTLAIWEAFFENRSPAEQPLQQALRRFLESSVQHIDLLRIALEMLGTSSFEQSLPSALCTEVAQKLLVASDLAVPTTFAQPVQHAISGLACLSNLNLFTKGRPKFCELIQNEIITLHCQGRATYAIQSLVDMANDREQSWTSAISLLLQSYDAWWSRILSGSLVLRDITLIRTTKVSLRELSPFHSDLRQLARSLIQLARSGLSNPFESLSDILDLILAELDRVCASRESADSPFTSFRKKYIFHGQQHIPSDSHSKLAVRAISIGQLIWRLYLPASPCDPAAEAWASFRSADRQCKHVLSRLARVNCLGLLDSYRGQTLQADFENWQSRRSSCRPSRCPERSFDRSTMHRLLTEIQNFDRLFYNDGLIGEVQKLANAPRTSNDNAWLEGVSQSTHAFQMKLCQLFSPLYDDICQPLHLSLQLLRLGLDCLWCDRSTNTNAVLKFISYPSSHDPAVIEPESMTEDHALANMLLINRICCQVGGRMSDHCLRALNQAMEHLYRIWENNEKESRQRALEAQAEYRMRQEIDEDLQIDELFGDQNTKASHLSSITTSVADLFISAVSGVEDRSLTRQAIETVKNTLMERVGEAKIRPENEQSFAVWQIDNLIDVYSPHLKKAGHFYKDPVQPIDYTRVGSILDALSSKIHTLRIEFPDNMALQLVEERINNIGSMNSDSTSNALLRRLEDLLTPLEDWQSISHREISLHAEKSLIIDHIIELRKLEIDNWQTLLHGEQQAFVSRAKEQFWDLYGLLLGFNDDMRASMPLLLKYFDDAPLGQFSTRLQLLRSFLTFRGQYLQQIKADKALLSVCARYELHLPAVQVEIHAQVDLVSSSADISRKTLSSLPKHSKKLQDIVKLAKWKDINVEALRQSAKNSHRVLNKLIRSFRQSLQRQSGPFFRRHHASTLPYSIYKIESHQFPTSSRRLSTIDDWEFYAQPAKTLDRLSSSYVISLSSQTIPRQIFELNDSIKSLSRALREEKLPLDDHRALSSLTNRKRKAVSDFLKEFKRLGLSRNPSDTILSSQRDLKMMHSLGSSKTEHSNSAFYQLLDDLAEIRTKTGDFHQDLNPHQMAHAFSNIESLFHLILIVRKHLIDLEIDCQTYKQCERWLMTASLEDFSNQRISFGDLFQRLTTCAGLLEQLSTSLNQHSNEIAEPFATDLFDATLGRIRILAKDTAKQVDSRLPPLADSDDLVARALNCLQSVSTSLQGFRNENPQWEYLLLPVAEAISTLITEPLQEYPGNQSHPDLLDAQKVVVDLVLVAFQQLDQIDFVSKSVASDHLSDSAILTIVKEIRQAYRVLALPRASEAIHQFASVLSSPIIDPKERLVFVDRALFFVARLGKVAEHILAILLRLHDALIALASTLCETCTNLAENGFCKPQSTEEDHGPVGEDRQGELTEGTGLGEGGQGEKNISSEVENQEQVEGLENEDITQQEKSEGADQEQDKDAVEAGDMDMTNAKDEDVEMTSEASNEKDDQSSDEAEEQVDNVDPLTDSAVDEKFWTSKEETDVSGKQEKELAEANETERRQSEIGPRQDVEKTHSEHEFADRDQEMENEANEGSDQPDDTGLPPEVEIPEGRPLDDVDQDDFDHKSPSDVVDHEREVDDAIDEQLQEAGHADEETAISDNFTPSEISDHDRDVDMQDAATETDFDNGKSAEEPISVADTQMKGAGEENGSQQQPSQPPQPQKERSLDDIDFDYHNDQQDSEAKMPVSEGTSRSQQQSGNKQDYAVQQSDQPPVPEPEDAHDHQAELGTALEDWSRRLKIIEKSHSDDSPEPQSEGREGGDEAIHAQAGQHDNQALGAADQSDAAKTRDMTDAKETNVLDNDEISRDPHSITDPKSQLDAISLEALQNADERSCRQQFEGNSANSLAPAADGPPQIESGLMPESEGTDTVNPSGNGLDSSSLFALNSVPVSSAAAWHQYSNSVQSMSFALTEQLRLILEPTQASRLEGDYRTGKRLNMKRIIPFIASEFTKDKIWLRRTKPFDRRYQVMISLDDSSSMSDQSTVHLAFQSLALVTSALTRLEVGQVAVTSFANEVVPIHAFDAGPVTDEAGARILERFTFRQNRTDYVELLHRTLADFQGARQNAAPSSNSEELWQLQIIISDGFNALDERIPALLRKAKEAKVLIVFVVLDHGSFQSNSTASASTDVNTKTSSAQSSILDAQHVLPSHNAATGKMQIKLVRYLDYFPFEYYVVLRRAEDLPDMLCRLLRQFFGLGTF